MYWLEHVLKTKILEIPLLTKVRKSDIIRIMRESRAIDKIYGFRPAISNVEREIRKFNSVYKDLPQVSFTTLIDTRLGDIVKSPPEKIRDFSHLLPDSPKPSDALVLTRNKIDTKKVRKEIDSKPDRGMGGLPPSGY